MLKNVSQTSIATKLAMIQGSLLLVMLGAGAWLVSVVATHTLDTVAVQNTTARNRGLIDLIGATDGALRARAAQVLTHLRAQFPQAFSGDAARVDARRLDEFATTQGAWVSLFVEDGEGFRRVRSTLGDHAGPEHLGRDAAVSQPIVKLATLQGRQYLTTQQPVTDAKGRVIGLVVSGPRRHR